MTHAFPIHDHPTVLWTLHLDGRIASCDVRFVMWSNEVTVLRNGRLLFSRVFATGDEAPTEAEQERQGMVSDGWQ